jgi:hypothetical protein
VSDKIKIGVFPADLEGCGHYRLIWPGFELQSRGLDVTIVPPDKRDGLFNAVLENDVMVDVMVPDYDVMIFQRVTHRYLAQAIPFIRSKGVAVVVDIDDDLEAIHPSNPAWQTLHPRNVSNDVIANHSWKWARVACESATFVTVSSEALLSRYARHSRGAVIRNYVPETYLTMPHPSSTVIGWAGSLHSHPNDVPKLGTSIAQMVRQGCTFKVIGPGRGMRQALRLTDEPDATGPVPLDEWPLALAQLGIGLAPLDHVTRFNAAKSWLKPLEYASVGAVPIMSPSPEYRRIHKLGVGLLAERPSDWVRQMKRLVSDDTLRDELALKVRQVVANELTIQRNGHRWEEAWTRAYELERTHASSR